MPCAALLPCLLACSREALDLESPAAKVGGHVRGVAVGWNLHFGRLRGLDFFR